MEAGNRDDLVGRLALTAVFAEVPDPCVVGRSHYDLVEMFVISVCAMLCGVEDFVGIESWSKERIDWQRRFLPLKNGIPSHDTLDRLFALLDRRAAEKSFRAWVGSVRRLCRRSRWWRLTARRAGVAGRGGCKPCTWSATLPPRPD